MKILIKKDPLQNRWWVHMDEWVAGFHSLQGAESFVERLNARIHAPHAPHMIGSYSQLSQEVPNSQSLNRHDGPHLEKKLSHA